MNPPYLPSAIPPATAHVTAAHHYLALAAGGAFARSRTDTGWKVTLDGEPVTLLAALTASVLFATGLITWMPTWSHGEVSVLTPTGRRQLRTWERDVSLAAT